MSTFGIVLLVLILLAVLAGTAWLSRRYFRFLSTVEAAWRWSVLDNEATLKNKIAALKKVISDTRRFLQVEVEKERSIAFRRYLATISVDVLQAYPGIGPATVEKLRPSRLPSLDLLQHTRLNLPGIGPKRLQDLQNAVSQVLRDAKSRFDAGGCYEAQELALRLQIEEGALIRQIASAEQALLQTQRALNQLQPYITIARKITFLGDLRNQKVPEVTKALLAKPVSDYLIVAEPPSPPLPAQAKPAVAPPPKPAVVRSPAPRGVWVAESAPPTVPPMGAPPQPLTKAADLFRAAIESVEKPKAAPKPEHPRLPHLQATAQFGFAVARADGKVANAERNAIRKYLQQTFGHESELAPHINPLMEQVEKKTPKLEECLPALRTLFEASELEKLYRFAEAVADAAGKRTKKEIQCLKRISAVWGIKDGKTPAPSPTVVPPSAAAPVPVSASPTVPPSKPPGSMNREECLAALEIAATSALTADLVRRQYRLLSERFDPAKFESHGSEFVKVAKDKREKVEQAAKFLLEQFGEKLDEEKKPEAPQDLRHNPDLDEVFGM